ncbi:hypothetical protein [Actibacterium sp. XHP0104]|uniref:hypothetical protein n=1 Tax=Actibacterium sp. XHP0104 TaxID=2984335 RepID=UPI0021E74C82|nr:hypothetical protein [Actibacterium sp. XHP0104]MCV2880804.1 hypothetical protein [Actibacterium sp. XHP0104]
MKRVLPLVALLATPAYGTEPLTFTYEMFESAVTHADLAECPPELAGENRFCRATLHLDALNVFAFDDAGDTPLVAFQSYDASDLHSLLKTPLPD